MNYIFNLPGTARKLVAVLVFFSMMLGSFPMTALTALAEESSAPTEEVVIEETVSESESVDEETPETEVEEGENPDDGSVDSAGEADIDDEDVEESVQAGGDNEGQGQENPKDDNSQDKNDLEKKGEGTQVSSSDEEDSTDTIGGLGDVVNTRTSGEERPFGVSSEIPTPEIHSVRFSTISSSYNGIVIDQYLRGFTDATEYRAIIHRADGTDAIREGAADVISHINNGGNQALTTPFNFAGSSAGSWYGAQNSSWTYATRPIGVTIEVMTETYDLVTYSTPVSQALVEKKGKKYEDLIPAPEQPIINSTTPDRGGHISKKEQRIDINVVNQEDVRTGNLQLNKVVTEGQNPLNGDRKVYTLQKDAAGWYANVDTTELEDGAKYLFKVEAHGFDTPHGYYGNNSAWQYPSFYFVVDNTAPAVEQIVPSDGESVKGNVEMSFKIVDNVSGVEKAYFNIKNVDNENMSVDGKSTFWMTKQDNDVWTYSIDTKQLPDGVYSFHVRTTDNAGNSRHYNIHNHTGLTIFTVDNTAPKITSVEFNKMVNIDGVDHTSAKLNGGFLDVTFTTDEPLKLVGSQVGLAIPGMGGPPATGWTKAELVDASENKYVARISLTNRTDTGSANYTKDFFVGKQFENIKLYFRTVDTLGNTDSVYYYSDGSFGAYTFVLDNVAPEVINVTSDGKDIKGQILGGEHDFKVNFTEDDLAKAYVEYMKLEWTESKGEWEFKKKVGKLIENQAQPILTVDTTNWADGKYRIKVTQITDKLGNTAKAYTVDFEIDNSPPTAPVITKPGVRQWFNSSSILNQWTEADDSSGISHYQIAYNYADGHTFDGVNTCEGVSIPGATGFVGCRDVDGLSRSHKPNINEQGKVTVWVRAVDNIGNVGPWSTPVYYYYDQEAPVTDIKVSSVDDNKFTVSGHATDNEALNRVYVQLVHRESSTRYGGTTVNLIPEGKNADWSVSYDATKLPEGTYAAHVSVVDRAGNSSTAGWTENFAVEVSSNPDSDNGNQSQSGRRTGGSFISRLFGLGGSNDNDSSPAPTPTPVTPVFPVGLGGGSLGAGGTTVALASTSTTPTSTVSLVNDEVDAGETVDATTEEDEMGVVEQDSEMRLAAAAFLGLSDEAVDGLRSVAIFTFFLILIAILTVAYDATRRASGLTDQARVLGRINFVAMLLIASTILALVVPLSAVIWPLYISAWLAVGAYFVMRTRLAR